MNRRIFDCFNFFNELDILEIRLNTLDPYVDYFIISESNKTFNNELKPLYYEENKERYKKFWPKIIHQIITDYPQQSGILSIDTDENTIEQIIIKRVNFGNWFDHSYHPYVLDTFSKEVLLRAISEHAQPEDIIMLSDADEIPNPDALKFIFDNFDENQVYNLNQNWYHYYLNLRKKQDWLGNMILTYKNFLTTNGMCELKMRRRGLSISNGGWHFSYVGNFDKIIEKLNSSQEHTWDVKLFKDNLQDSIDNVLTCGHDLHFWPSEFEIVNINTMPKYVIDNQEKFKSLLKYE